MMMAIGDADNQKGVSIRKWTKGDDGRDHATQRRSAKYDWRKTAKQYRYVRANTIQENGGGGSSKSPCDSIAGKKEIKAPFHKADATAHWRRLVPIYAPTSIASPAPASVTAMTIPGS